MLLFQDAKIHKVSKNQAGKVVINFKKVEGCTGKMKSGRLPLMTSCLMFDSRLVKQSPGGGLDHTLLEHSLSDLHEAGDVSALHVVDGAVSLAAVLHALLVDALHDPVKLSVNLFA